MQLAIELPDELVFDIQNSLKQQDIKQFVLEAVKSKFLQEREAQQQKELMTLIKAIKPVKAPLSSEDIVRMLREGKDHELSKMRVDEEQPHLPITQSLIGLLKGSNLDIADYKKHLEEKYL